MGKEWFPLNGERMVSLTNGAGTVGFTHAKELNLDPYLTPYKKN